ncbi:MAG: UvrD-helicase domain-containing protein [Bryobacteraceae bacterium]|nr:UvrD-helicase domain-containing protein [Bryobacteraceae bacterium]
MDFLSGLNPEQRRAVEHVEGPLLILAGAGSGKTRVITHRIAHLIAHHRVYGPSILAVTFTNKAAGEMRDRVLRLLGGLPASSGPVVSTFHSFCVRLLRRDGASLAELRPGFTTSFHIYDEQDQLALLKQIYKRLGLDEKALPPRGVLSRISHAKNQKLSPEDFYRASADPSAARIAVLYEHYQRGLEAANALDFDDLLLEAVRLLRHDEAVRDLWNRRIEFLMIDEYQDTNRPQYELMRLLTVARSNVAVVGDEDQSIYGWRGADIRNILDFERDFPGAAVIRLEQNYRSTKTILEAASRVVERNTARKGKTLWTNGPVGDPICYFEAEDGEQEALFIADTIRKLLAADPATRVAVLYRTNFQSRQIEEALRRYNLPYRVVGGLSFYQRAEVKDILAYLHLLLNPRDNVSLLRILNVPARGIGRTTAEHLESIAVREGLCLWEAIRRALDQHELGARAGAALSAFVRLIEELRQQMQELPPHEVISLVLERTGYRRMLEAEGTPESESRLANLEELISAAADAAERGDSLQEFLDTAALVSDADDIDETARVSLLTMHNAKGLEFPVVFVAGMEEGLFPHSRSLNDEAMLEEERRLCYVAMTRAMRRLYLTSARFRRRYGGAPLEPSQPSRFLEEIPRHLVEELHEPRAVAGALDLLGERAMVREAVRKHAYTGKTVDSIDHIQRFFAGRAQRSHAAAPPAPAPASRPAAAPQPPAGPPAAQAAPAPKPPAARQNQRRGIRPGASVLHPKYGRGTVLRLEGEGDDARLTVSFPGYGLKKLVARYAGLQTED